MSKENLNNVVQVSTLDMEDVIKIHMKKGQTPFFIGPPGVGKSKAIVAAWKQLATEANGTWVENPTMDQLSDPAVWTYVVVLASQIEEIDARGLPNVTSLPDGTKVTVYTNTELFPTFAKAKVMVLLDEFPNGRTQVQNALQSIILDRRVGNTAIPTNVSFICAGNRPQDNCGTYYIPSALRNRVFWYEVHAPNTQDWLALMKRIGRPLNPWLAGFILSIGEKYSDTFDPKSELYAFGTRRSLEMASTAMDGVQDHRMIKILVGGAIGQAAGHDLVEFMKLSEKVDIDDLLKNPHKIKQFTNGDPGLLYSIAVALIKRCLDPKTSDATFGVLRELEVDEYGLFVLNGMLREASQQKVIQLIKNSPNGTALLPKYHNLLFN